MSKFCPKCGLENEEEAKFCKRCGSSLDAQVQSKSSRNVLIIVVVAILCVAAIAGTIIYLNADSDFNLFNTNEPIHIINTTFSTGNSLSSKTVCTINVGTEHADEEITVSVVYSRDGNNLNDGDKSIKTVGKDGNIVCESKDSFKKYPDHAIVTIYDKDGNILDTADITLATDDSTQVAIGNGTITAKSVTIAQHAAASNAAKSKPSAYAYKSDGTPMYSQEEVDNYMLNKYGSVNYHIANNKYIHMDEPGYERDGTPIKYFYD